MENLIDTNKDHVKW